MTIKMFFFVKDNNKSKETVKQYSIYAKKKYKEKSKIFNSFYF